MSSSGGSPKAGRDAIRHQIEQLLVQQTRINDLIVILQSKFGDDINNDSTTSINDGEYFVSSTIYQATDNLDGNASGSTIEVDEKTLD